MRVLRKSLLTGFVALLLTAFTSVAFAQQSTVVDVINSNKDLSTFAKLVKKSEVSSLLSQQGPFTVMAPSNEALDKMGDKLDELENNPQELRSFVERHLHRGQISAQTVQDSVGVTVKKGDLKASNGVVHIIGGVITSE